VVHCKNHRKHWHVKINKYIYYVKNKKSYINPFFKFFHLYINITCKIFKISGPLKKLGPALEVPPLNAPDWGPGPRPKIILQKKFEFFSEILQK